MREKEEKEENCFSFTKKKKTLTKILATVETNNARTTKRKARKKCWQKYSEHNIRNEQIFIDYEQLKRNSFRFPVFHATDVVN